MMKTARTMLRQTLLALTIGTTLIVAGCGGGGDSGGQTSDLSQLNISFKTNLPAQIKATEGETLRLSVEVQANRPGGVDYEWYFNNKKLSVPSNTSTLLLPDIKASQQGQYKVIVRDVFNENNFITSNIAQVTVEQKQAKPAFSQAAGMFNIVIGDEVTLNSAATGFPVPTYQWYKDGKPLAGQNGANLTLKNAKKEDSGVYYVVGKNAIGQTQSAEYKVNVALQLATGVWFGTLDKQQLLFAVAPNGRFVFNANSEQDGAIFATGDVRTTSVLQEGSSIRFHPKAEVSALIADSNGNILPGDNTLSFTGTGVSFTPQSRINSSFVQIGIQQQVTSTISLPKYSFAKLDLEYDPLISNLISTPQDIAGAWQITSGGSDSQIMIDQNGKLTGMLFDGACEIQSGKVIQATDSKTFYTVQYTVAQATGKSCPIGLYNPVFKGLAFRIPNTTTGKTNLYMSSYFVLDDQVISTHPLFFSR